MIFEFDNCVLDTSKQELRRDGELVHIEPQVLAVLEYLASNAERVVTKIELLDEVWGDRFVSESALTSRIKLARKACGDNGREQRILKTVHSRGYRFVASMAERQGAAPAVGDQPDSSSPDASSPRRSAPIEHRASTAIFGRSGELGLLDAAMADTERGSRRAVFLRGGLGSGKSTLVAEFLERQDHHDEMLVARGQCIQTRGGVEPYFCLLDALGQLARAEPEVATSTLGRVAPSWLAQMPSLLDHDTFETLERRLLGSNAARMLREGAEAFEALARDRPLVLVLEDLQWADDCTLDVIDLLLQRTDSVRLLLLGTTRAEATGISSVIAPAVAGRRGSLIELSPLDREAVRALASDRLDGADVPEELVTIIARRCDGIPLFAEEIVSSWLRQGQIEIGDGAVSVTCAINVLEAAIPPTLPPLIERELDALDAEELAILEVCAVAGDAFDTAAVAAGLEQPVAATEGVLAAFSRQRGIIGATGASAWPDGTISATYAFTQELFREVIYDRIPASRRATLHARVGESIEVGHGERAAEMAVTLAGHFIQAGDTLRSVEYLQRAGEQASARNAHSHAVGFFTDALTRLAAIDPSGARDHAERQVRTSLGPALVAAKGWFDESVSVNYERALELCADEPGCTEAAAARYGLATVSELQGRFERTEALLTPLLAAESDGHLALEAHELVACSTFHQGAFDRSLHNASIVLDSWDEDVYSVSMARIAEHPASSCSSWSSLALWALGRSDESLRLAERAVDLGERNPYALSTAVQQRAMLHQLRNEPRSCIEWAERCRQVGEDQNFPMRTIQADIYKGWALSVSGSFDEGHRLIFDGLARFRAAGATLNEAYYLAMYADALLHGGDPQRAIERLTEALERSTSRTYFYEPELCRLMARGRLDVGNADAVEQSRTALDDGRAVAQRLGAPALELRAVSDRLALELAHGDPDPWRGELAELLTIYDGQAPIPDSTCAHGLLGD